MVQPIQFRRFLLVLRAIFLVALYALSTPTSAQFATESRLALVIGNASYKSSPLANPVNDARLMEAALKDAGFTVIKAENASLRDMRRLVRDFGDRLKASGGVGLFYFAGHGVQVRGENYLVSVDSDIRNEDEVADDAINAQLVLEKMQTAGNRMNLIVLDACRNNPFAVKSRSAASGLATMSAPSGSLVAYSTAPGSVASDGTGSNGLYTQHLARVIRQAGLPVEEVFKQVRASVRRESNNQQTPWENTALEGQFYFKPPVQVAAPVPVPAPVPAPVAAPPKPSGPDPMQLELALWDSIKASTTPAEIQAYLNRYPSGLFADVAKARIAALQAVASERAAVDKAAAERAFNERVAAEVNLAKARLAEAQASRPPATPPALVAAAPVAMPAAAAAPMAPSLAKPAGHGTLVVKDALTGKEQRIDVVPVQSDAKGVRWSTGDIVAADGQVLAVRIGTLVATLKSGALWKLPLQPGANGSAVVEMEGYPLPGRIDWKVVARNGDRVTLETKIDYYTSGFQTSMGRRSGSWNAQYQDGVPMPVSYRMDVRGISSMSGGPDIFSGELQNVATK